MNAPPRVLLCCEHYPPSIGGVQEVMRQIAERLASDGADVTVATSEHPDREMDVIREGVRVVSFPISGNLARGLRGPVAQYRDFLRQGKFDAILIKAAQQWTFDAALDVLNALPARKIFIPCGFSGLNDPRYADYFRQMPDWLRLFDGLVFYANDYQDIAFARRHGLQRLHHIPNGVDESEFQDLVDHGIRERLNIPRDEAVLLSVGSRIASKGHWEVIRAFGRARLNRPATLVINANGAGPLAARFKRLLKHAANGHWPLTWLGWWIGRRQGRRVLIVDLPRKELIDLYKTADIFLTASHVEYSPLVLFEAVAARTPFISSAAGNSGEIAAWTGGGRVLKASPAKDPDLFVREMATAVEEYLRDSTGTASMGLRGRESIFNQGYVWQKIVKRYRSLLLPPELE